jgi:hypothetical protein
LPQLLAKNFQRDNAVLLMGCLVYRSGAALANPLLEGVSGDSGAWQGIA